MEEAKLGPSDREFLERWLVGQVGGFEASRERVVRDLRQVADRIEADERRQGSVVGEGYVALAERVAHAVLWLVPNLRLEELVGQASRLDEARHHIADELAKIGRQPGL